MAQALLGALLIFPIPSLAGGGKLALLIGNQSYAEAPLQSAINDANDMADTLENLGFDVILVKDGDLKEMEDAVRKFRDQLNRREMGLFFYAGHGVQAEGVNYLIPVNADIHGVQDLRYKTMDAGFVLDSMKSAGSKFNVVILDACRNNPFAGARGGSRGLSIMTGPTGSIIAYATAPNETAQERDGRNGVYTKSLLRHIKSPGLTIEEMFKQVRKDVSEETSDRQVPWENSSFRGNFCFSGCESPAAKANTAEMMALIEENKRLAEQLSDMRNKASENEQRQERLRSEKQKLESHLESSEVNKQAQQEYQNQLNAILREKQELEQALRERNQDRSAQSAKLEELSHLSKEKSRLEEELKKYEQADRLRSAQLQELERIKKEKQALENEAKRYSSMTETMSARLEDIERLKRQNAQLSQQNEELSDELKTTRSSAKGQQPAREETYVPMIVNP
jgi:uncharacterized caspase-like protein